MSNDKVQASQWLIGMMIAVIGFLAGSNVSAWAFSNNLNLHKMEEGHPVIKSRVSHVEKDFEQLRAQHIDDMKKIQTKLDIILDKLESRK
jgi:hypothetical protein